jgi:hypothetical protein
MNLSRHGANGSDPRIYIFNYIFCCGLVVTLPYEALHVVDEHVTY